MERHNGTAPGVRDGDLHYHEPNDTKWRYDIENDKLTNPATGESAPPRIEKVQSEKWFLDAIAKGKKVPGE